MAMTKVYISSTYTDLVEYRAVATQAIRKAGNEVVSMEDYAANDIRPLDKCLSDVAGCDIYVGIFGFRYGFVPVGKNPGKLSITEMEYRAATRRKKKRLIFLADERRWPMIKSDHYTGEGQRGTKIMAFRERLNRELLRDSFDTPDGLAAAVAAAMANFNRGNSTVSQKQRAQNRELRRAAITIAGYFKRVRPGSRIVSYYRLQEKLNGSWSDAFLDKVQRRYPLSFEFTWTTDGWAALKYTGTHPKKDR
jgi:hypothetical protein